MEQLQLKRNVPFSVAPLKELLTSREEMAFVRPGASFPIMDAEWIAFFDSADKCSILVYRDRDLVGHFGLVKETEFRFRLVFLFLVRPLRGTGLAGLVLQAVEEFAWTEFRAVQLSLNVQEFNPRAISLYKKCGFKEFYQDGVTIKMEKDIEHKKYRLVEIG
jgi:RimJ/RimL family protein N-acetyltransferase